MAKIDDLIGEANKAIHAVRTAMGQAAAMPIDQAELAAAMDALLAADDAAKENLRRWPRYAPDGSMIEPSPYDSSEECRNSWCAAFAAKDKAVASLLALARARRDLAGIP